MTESFPSDALFGVDGTQMPEPLPDPLAGPGRGTGQDTASLPPFVLPPLPDASAIREAIAAALGDDPVEPVDSDAVTAPISAAAEQPDVLDDDDDEAPPAAAPAVAPPAGAPSGVRSGAAPPTEAGNRPAAHRPVVAPPIHPAPSSPQRLSRQRDRQSMPAELRQPVPPADLRRRIRRNRVGLQVRTRSDGGATAALIALLIFMAILSYYIVTGFLNSIANFFS